MRVLQLGKYYYPHMGGIENQLYLLSTELAKLGNDVTVAVSNDKPKFSKEIIKGVKVLRYPLITKIKNAPISSFPTFDSKQFDIVHVHLPNPLASIHALLNYTGNLVVTYHSDIIKEGILPKLANIIYTKTVLLQLLKRAKVIIATSPNYVSGSKILQKHKHKVKVVPYGIDLNLFKLNSASSKELEQLKKNYAGKKVLLFVGRLVPYKGLKYLIHAMREVVEKYNEAVLLIVGDGVLKSELEAIVKKLNLTKHVKFLSEIHNKDLTPYYYLSDMFILPSIYKSEAFGIVQLEAMACSKPIISTNVLGSGISYVNKNNETGIIIEPYDSRKLSSSMIKLLKNNSLKKKLGNNGKRRVKKFFSKEAMVKNILNIYNLILKHPAES